MAHKFLGTMVFANFVPAVIIARLSHVTIFSRLSSHFEAIALIFEQLSKISRSGHTSIQLNALLQRKVRQMDCGTNESTIPTPLHLKITDG
jgi:hypothetical protein